MKANNIIAIASAGLLVYLLYLFFSQRSANTAGGPGNAGLTFGNGGLSLPDCAAQICVGTPL